MHPEFSLSSPRAPRRSAPRRYPLRKRCSPRPILTAPEKFLRGQAHGFARLVAHPSPLRKPRSVSRLLGVAPIVPATTGRVWAAVRPSLSCQSAATTPLVRVHAAATTRRILHLSSQRSERGANGVRVATGVRLWSLGPSGDHFPHFPFSVTRSPMLPRLRFGRRAVSLFESPQPKLANGPEPEGVECYTDRDSTISSSMPPSP